MILVKPVTIILKYIYTNEDYPKCHLLYDNVIVLSLFISQRESTVQKVALYDSLKFKH